MRHASRRGAEARRPCAAAWARAPVRWRRWAVQRPSRIATHSRAVLLRDDPKIIATDDVEGPGRAYLPERVHPSPRSPGPPASSSSGSLHPRRGPQLPPPPAAGRYDGFSARAALARRLRSGAARAESRHRKTGEPHRQPEARAHVAADVVELGRVDRLGGAAALAEQVLAL